MRGCLAHRTLACAARCSRWSAAPARADGFITPVPRIQLRRRFAELLEPHQLQDKRVNWGVALGTTSGIFGFEEEFAYAPNFFGKTAGADNAVLTLMSNYARRIPAGPIQPYGLVGLGLMRPHAQFDASA